jgi:hypothetical protein
MEAYSDFNTFYLFPPQGASGAKNLYAACLLGIKDVSQIPMCIESISASIAAATTLEEQIKESYGLPVIFTDESRTRIILSPIAEKCLHLQVTHPPREVTPDTLTAGIKSYLERRAAKAEKKNNM